jgi:hypothetical protein
MQLLLNQAEDTIALKDKRIAELEKQVEGIAKHIHYPECWDIMAYPTLVDAVCEITQCDPEQCTHDKPMTKIWTANKEAK